MVSRDWNTAPPIGWSRGAGFVDYTVTRRFPKIASDVRAVLAGEPDRARQVEILVDGIMSGARIDVTGLARPTPFWSAWLDRVTAARWTELAFFEIEFLFYHALNSIAGYFENSTDVFRVTRTAARTQALAAAQLGLDRVPDGDDLPAALERALFGNEHDYSLFEQGAATGAAIDERLLVDERVALLSAIRALGSAAAPGDELRLIADNAGPELLADLVLVDRILSVHPSAAVIVHCKPWPMFVSDALVEDVEHTIDGLASHPHDRSARSAGERLRTARTAGRLRVQAEAAWGEPRFFDALGDDLDAALGGAAVVIAKGDLNYRRFVEDRAWPPDTPVRVAAASTPFDAYALRVLKSDALVGVPAAVAARAQAERGDWRTAGFYAVVQRMR